jgi:hypothetical protein
MPASRKTAIMNAAVLHRYFAIIHLPVNAAAEHSSPSAAEG